MWFVRVSIIVHNSLNGVTWYTLHYSSVLKKHQFKSLKYETATIGKQVRMHVMIRVNVDGSHIYFPIFLHLYKHSYFYLLFIVLACVYREKYHSTGGTLLAQGMLHVCGDIRVRGFIVGVGSVPRFRT